MKKTIPFILSLFILLPGCKGNTSSSTNESSNKISSSEITSSSTSIDDDNYILPVNEITKEEALNIFNLIDEKINEYIKEIKENKKSFYGIYEVEKYRGDTLRDSKLVCSVDFKNNEALYLTQVDDYKSGTYIIYDYYYEIKDEHWSRGIVLPLPNDDRVHYEHYVYKQKDSSKHKKMIDLTEDDFDFLYKKYIDKATIETLPLGTYMMKNYFPRLNRIDGPFIISIEKD